MGLLTEKGLPTECPEDCRLPDAQWLISGYPCSLCGGHKFLNGLARVKVECPCASWSFLRRLIRGDCKKCNGKGGYITYFHK